MANTQEFTTIIKLNDQEAKKTLEQLQKRVDDLKDARDKAIASKADTATIKELNKQYKAANSELKAYENNVSKTIHVIKNLSSSSSEDIKKTMKALKREQEKTTDPTAYAQLEEHIASCRTRLTELQHNQELVNETMNNLSGAKVKDLEQTAKLLNAQLKETEQGTKEYKQLTEQLKRVKTAIKDVNDETKESQSIWSRFTGFLNNNWGAITQILASLTGITLTIRKCVSAFAEMQEAMAQVRKYTGQTIEEVERMNEDFKNMDTRTARDKLNELAGAAGRLGITATEQIEEFVDAADKIGVALGDDLGQGAVDKIGKLAMAFGEDDKKGLRGAMLAIGSAINELAQNSSSQAGYLVEFTARVAGVGKQLGLSQADILGYAAVLDENMQKDEMAATAFTKLLSSMAVDTKTFAKMAGMEVSEFSKLIREDANEAVLKLMENLRKQGGFETLGKMFGDMGLDGSRALSVLTTMVDKIDDVRKRQELANEAYEDGTSVIEEFEVQNTTVQAGLDKAKKAFNEITIQLGEKLMPIARYGITTGTLMIKTMSTLVDFVTEHWRVLATLTAGILAYNAAAKAELVVTKLNAAWIAVKTAATTAYNVVVAVMTSRLNAAIFAQTLLNKVTLKNPYVAAAAAILGVASALALFTKRIDAAAEAQKAMNKIHDDASTKVENERRKIDNLRKAAEDETRSLSEREKAVKALNKIIPDYNAQIDKTTGKYKESKKALDKYLQSLQKRYELEGAEEQLKAIGQEKVPLEVQRREAEEALRKEEARQKKIFADAEKNNRTISAQEGQAYHNLMELRRGVLADVIKKLDVVLKKEKAITDVYGQGLQDKAIEESVTENNNNNDNNNNGGGTYETDKERRAREAREKKEKAEQKKRINEAIKNQKALAAAEEAEATQQYSQGLITYREYIQRKQDIAIDDLDKQIEIYGQDSDEAKKLQEKREELLLKYSNDQKLNEQEIVRNARRCAIELEMAYEDVNSELYHNDRALQEALFENEQESLINRRDLYKKNSQEWLDLDAQITERDEQHTLELRQRYADLLAQYRQNWARRDIAEEQRITLQGLDELHNRGLLKEEEYQEMIREIKLRYAQMQAEQNRDNSYQATTSRNADTAYKTAQANAQAQLGSQPASLGSYLMGDISLYQTTMEKLKEMYESDAITYEEYQQAKSVAFGNFAGGLASKLQAAYDAITPILNGMSSYWSAQSQYEQNVTTKKYDKLIEAAGNNTKKTKKLEEQKQKELAKIKTKYNKKAMKVEIAQATATMVLGAMNAYTGMLKAIPGPAGMIMATIAAGIATAAGLLNIATIKKQHEAEAAGYYSGGFTGGTSYHNEAGVVHEGEFVANHQAVANRRILPALQLIDQAQRNNTVASLTADDISRSVGGGQTVVSAPTVNVQTDNTEVVAVVSEARQVIGQLSEILQEPITAITSIDGEHGWYRTWKKWQRLQGNK